MDRDYELNHYDTENFHKYFPPTLYKFRAWSDIFHRRLITDCELFFPSPEKFNDPFDCLIPIDFKTLTPEERYEIYCHDLKIHYPDWTELERQKVAEEMVKKDLLKDPRHIQFISEELLKRIIHQQYGVASFSIYNHVILMWSHYADHHRGFCVGLDTEKLHQFVKGTIARIYYSENYPKIKPLNRVMDSTDDLFNEIFKIISTKNFLWAYEGEYRIFKANAANAALTLPKEIVKEVIIGCKTPPNEIKEILNVVKVNLPNANLFIAERHPEKYELLINPLKKLETVVQ